MWIVYIIESEKTGYFYIGYTRDVNRMVREHNAGKTKMTRDKGPWKVVNIQKFATEQEALAREKQMKAWKAHETVKRYVDYMAANPPKDNDVQGKPE
jgi:putative endonuclease